MFGWFKRATPSFDEATIVEHFKRAEFGRQGMHGPDAEVIFWKVFEQIDLKRWAPEKRALFMEGYRWYSCKPWNPPRWTKLRQGLCHATGSHYPNRGGSWCFGYDYVCGGCGMYVGKKSDEWCRKTADAITDLPADQQHQAASFYSGGRG